MGPGGTATASTPVGAGAGLALLRAVEAASGGTAPASVEVASAGAEVGPGSVLAALWADLGSVTWAAPSSQHARATCLPPRPPPSLQAAPTLLPGTLISGDHTWPWHFPDSPQAMSAQNSPSHTWKGPGHDGGLGTAWPLLQPRRGFAQRGPHLPSTCFHCVMSTPPSQGPLGACRAGRRGLWGLVGLRQVRLAACGIDHTSLQTTRLGRHKPTSARAGQADRRLAFART